MLTFFELGINIRLVQKSQARHNSAVWNITDDIRILNNVTGEYR